MYGAVHDTTLPVELKNAQYAGLLDPGRYKVSVKMSNKAKECITGMRIFGNEKDFTDDCYTDKGCIRTLHPVTEPEIEFQFSSDRECMRDMSVYITIVPVTTDEAELDDKMTFQIGLRPLTVSFEDLVKIVTYPNYRNIEDSKSLRNEVLTLIALDMQNEITDWKRVVIPEDGKAGEFQIKVVGTSLHLEHIPKNGNEPDWWIEFPHGISVWVKDAEDVKEEIGKEIATKCEIPAAYMAICVATAPATTEACIALYLAGKLEKCTVACDPIRGIIDETYGSNAYKNYLLTVKFGGAECEGLNGYGAKAEKQLEKVVTSWKPYAAWSGACFAGTMLCAAVRATAGDIWGAIKDGIKGATYDCTVAPGLAYVINQLIVASGLINTQSRLAPAIFGDTDLLSIYLTRKPPSQWLQNLGEKGIRGRLSNYYQWVAKAKRTSAVMDSIQGAERAAKKGDIKGAKNLLLKAIETAKRLGLVSNADDLVKVVDSAEDSESIKSAINEIKKSISAEKTVELRTSVLSCGTIGNLFGVALGSTLALADVIHVGYSTLSADVQPIPAAHISVSKESIKVEG